MKNYLPKRTLWYQAKDRPRDNIFTTDARSLGAELSAPECDCESSCTGDSKCPEILAGKGWFELGKLKFESRHDREPQERDCHQSCN